MSTPDNEVLVEVKGVSKKFCKSLRRSLRYGLADVTSELVGRRGNPDKLRKDEFWAVNDVSFELRRGECLGLIGHNGAGKSTLLKMLNGLITPDKGEIKMRGRVGALIELGAGFNPILTGRENVYVNGQILGFSRKEIEAKFDDIVEFAEIGDFIDSPVQNFSSGMKVRLGFAVAAQMEPDILLIDEVLAVGDQKFKMKCYEELQSKMEKGVSVILVSHSVVDIMRMSKNVIVLNRGEITYLGETQKGITYYNSLVADINNQGHDESDDFSISIKSFDMNGTLTNEFETDDDIELLITINSKVTLPNARIIFHLEYSTTRLSSVSSHYTGFNLDLQKGENVYKLKLKNVPLLIGGYIVLLELYGPRLKDFYSKSDFYPIRIIAPSVNYSGLGRSQIVAIDHEWSKM